MGHTRVGLRSKSVTSSLRAWPRPTGDAMGIKTVLGIALLALLLAYIFSYVGLSAGGCYEPAAIGLGGVKSYSWAPRGFIADYKWRHWPMFVYLPLWALDRHLWHTDDKSRSGRYPVDEVKLEDIWKVYKASGFFDEKAPPAAEKEKPPK